MSLPSAYAAYGLSLSCNYPLPYLPRTEAAVEIRIHYGRRLEPLTQPPRYHQVWWRQEQGDWIWDYRKSDGLVIRMHFRKSGRELELAYSRPELEDLFPLLMGPGLGAALHLRGVPLLHGASVVLNGEAILIAGLSEMGKSTLTARLVAAGLALLTEDLTPVIFSGPEVHILPGYPALQLHASTLRGLGLAPAACPRVYQALFPEEDKRWLEVNRLAGGFQAHPARLRLIYLLSGRRPELQAPQFSVLPPTMACLALLEHLYGTLWLNLPPQQSLNLCASLAERVQVRRVLVPEGLDTVAATAQALLADAGATW